MGLLGQYRGYKEDKGVPDNSKTATFAMLKLGIDTPSLHGVPVFLRCGKCLRSRKCEILLAINPEFGKTLEIPGFVSVSSIRIGIQPEMGIWIHGIREGESK